MRRRKPFNDAHTTTLRDLVAHRFAMTDAVGTYVAFGEAAKEGALKALLRNDVSG
jgi:hypothetical protein